MPYNSRIDKTVVALIDSMFAIVSSVTTSGIKHSADGLLLPGFNAQS